ncbi:hypothetical protein ACTWJ8_39825 (plasmid) [Streptomyces sp. SDT5-1]|uniref:hypothetical protein n=1 Tax=Streptomyces sp. SDT5-1 TaxID=3406418 RepID=UPI003FD46C69
MLAAIRHLFRPARVTISRALNAPFTPDLPPEAKKAMPGASGEECIAYNRARKVQAITVHLMRTGAHARPVADLEILDAAKACGWRECSPKTLAAVRAAHAVLRHDPGVHLTH